MEKKNKSINIEILNMGKTVVASHGQSMLDALLESKVPIDHSCGGMASCGTCLVEVLAGQDNLERPNDLELEMIRDRGFRAQERLACQSLCKGSVNIKIISIDPGDPALSLWKR